MPTFGKRFKGAAVLEWRSRAAAAARARRAEMAVPPADGAGAGAAATARPLTPPPHAAPQLARLAEALKVEKEGLSRTRREVLARFAQLLRNEKREELRRSLGGVQEAFQAQLADRERTLGRLAEELGEVEQQQQGALAAHLCRVDELLEIHRARADALEASFQGFLQTRAADHGEEVAGIAATHEGDLRDLGEAIDCVQADELRRREAMDGEREAVVEEIRAKGQGSRAHLRARLEARLEALRRSAEELHDAHVETTHAKREHFSAASRAAAQRQREIAARSRRIERLRASVATWQRRIAALSAEGKARAEQISAERNFIAGHCRSSKERLAASRRAHAARTKRLVCVAEDCKASLKNQIELAERILKLGEISRKAESAEEALAIAPAAGDTRTVNILLVGDADARPRECTEEMQWSPKVADGDPWRARDAEPAPTGAYGVVEGRPLRRHELLKRFFNKLNAAALSTLEVQRERDRLMAEREHLERALRHLIEGFTVSEDALERPNALVQVLSMTTGECIVPAGRSAA